MANSDLEMKIVSIAISKKKGTPKVQVEKASLLEDHGLEGDAHAGPWHRQVSFLELLQRILPHRALTGRISR